MRIFTLIIILSIFSFKTVAQKKPFVHKEIDKYVELHNKIAILPFKVISKPKKLPEDMTMEMLKEGEKERGVAMQNSMYSYYVRKLHKKELVIQDPEKTNRLLKKEGITIDNVFDYEPIDLAKILNVDAVFLNKAITDEPLTAAAKTAAVVKNLAFGLGSSKVITTTSIYDGNDGELIWRWEITLKGGVTDSDRLIESLMKNYISKKSPYRKKG